MLDNENMEATSSDEPNLRTSSGFNDGNMTRDTNDDIFAAEFNAMMKTRANNGGAVAKEYQIPFIKVPELNLREPGDGLLYASVENVDCDYYSALNGNIVEVIRDRTVKCRKALNDGSFRKDSNGKVQLFDYHVDAGSYVIKSTINIKKPNYVIENGQYKTDRQGNRIRYVDPSGYGYIDYENRGNQRYFIYAIPKTKLYKANMTALVLSNNPHIGNAYYGYKIAFTNGVYNYLTVINYKRNQNDNTTRVLGISNKIDYKAEINELIQFWRGIGKYQGQKPYMFNPEITAVPYSSGKIANNIGVIYFRGKLAMESYISSSTDPFVEDETEGENG